MENESAYPPSTATWRFFLDRRRRTLLERRRKLEEDTHDCLQLEASLIQLEAENVAAMQKLREREIMLRQSRDALDQRKRARAAGLSALEEDVEKVRGEHRFEERKLDNACEKLEAEKSASAASHRSTMASLAARQEQLHVREQESRERKYRLADAELELASRARRVQSCRDAAQKAAEETIAQLKREAEQLASLTQLS